MASAAGEMWSKPHTSETHTTPITEVGRKSVQYICTYHSYANKENPSRKQNNTAIFIETQSNTGLYGWKGELGHPFTNGQPTYFTQTYQSSPYSFQEIAQHGITTGV